jgi:uncharacterized protein
VAATSGDRSAHFPAIEKKHGLPISHWLDVIKQMSESKYAEQMAYLQENHGFSRTHANAVILYARGSKSSRRFNTIDDYLAQFDDTKQATVRAILSAITDKFPDLETVIAWNAPMLKYNTSYIFGVSIHTNHILIAPWNAQVLEEFKPRLADYEINKKTIKVPTDWSVDKKLLRDMIGASIQAEINDH